LVAVRQDGHAIRYIKNPSEQEQLEAVRQNGLAVVYITNPSPAVQYEAISQTIEAIKHINNLYPTLVQGIQKLIRTTDYAGFQRLVGMGALGRKLDMDL
jgi:6-phosphogluconolactonase/glucosamine-6-phosphate isomerase/deaminase